MTHRRPLDRIASFVIPNRRWVCDSCSWSGLRVDRHALKHLRRRVSLLLIILLAFLAGLAILSYLDYLKYSYHPPVEDQEPASGP